MASLPSSLPRQKLPQFITLHIRLDRQNYTHWRSQILASVRAQGFEDVLLCNAAAPFDAESSSSSSPYFDWIRQDQFVLSWILSSISDSMLGHVSRCDQAFQVWSILDELFRSQSKAHVMHLRL